MRSKPLCLIPFFVLLFIAAFSAWSEGNDVEFSVGIKLVPISIVWRNNQITDHNGWTGEIGQGVNFEMVYNMSGVEVLWRFPGWILPFLVGGSIGLPGQASAMMVDVLAGTEFTFFDDSVNRIGLRAMLDVCTIGSWAGIYLRTDLNWCIRRYKSFGIDFSAGVQTRFDGILPSVLPGWQFLPFSILLGVALVL